jgi:hypothetical protein
MNTTHTLRTTVLAATLALLAAHGHAALNSDTYDRAKDELKALYKSELALCEPMSGNAKDICVETAKGREKVALAHLEMQRTGKPGDVAKFQEARFAAQYEVAKERCDDQSGQQKDVCMTAAKTERDKAKASAKARKDMAEARRDEDSARAEADYKLAREKCDSLQGNGKDVCVATAKARFNQ